MFSDNKNDENGSWRYFQLNHSIHAQEMLCVEEKRLEKWPHGRVPMFSFYVCVFSFCEVGLKLHELYLEIRLYKITSYIYMIIVKYLQHCL